jgi:hypothetical protein
LFDFFSTCHWSNKTLIELNPKTNYVRLMFCSTFNFRFSLSLSLSHWLIDFFSQKRDIPVVELTLFWIVEQNRVEHPNSRRTHINITESFGKHSHIFNTSNITILQLQLHNYNYTCKCRYKYKYYNNTVVL